MGLRDQLQTAAAATGATFTRVWQPLGKKFDLLCFFAAGFRTVSLDSKESVPGKGFKHLGQNNSTGRLGHLADLGVDALFHAKQKKLLKSLASRCDEFDIYSIKPSASSRPQPTKIC